MVAVEDTRGAHANAQRRRRIAIDALGRQLNAKDENSAARRLEGLLSSTRPMLVSGDIDGVVSAAMLGSVAAGFKIAAIVMQSSYVLVHPQHADAMANDFFGVDVFSTKFDNVSNHVVKYGRKQVKNPLVRAAFEIWDQKVEVASRERLLAVPSVWANTQGCYEDADKPDSSRYKYPFGTAQIMLALLEATGNGPKFYDRTYLPWLVANCDGGISTYSRYSDNARVWWPVMAGAIGPGSLTEQIFRNVETMRPLDFQDAVHQLERERGNAARFLKDDWNLYDQQPATIANCLRWLLELTGWDDPVLGGVENMAHWKRVALRGSGVVYLGSKKGMENEPETVASTSERPEAAAKLIFQAENAINANFYHGGMTGSRFNWVGEWPSLSEPPLGVPVHASGEVHLSAGIQQTLL